MPTADHLAEFEQDRLFVTALARGLAILETFKADETYLSNQVLAQRTQLPKSTVSRLSYTLTKLGYLVQDAHSQQYRLGMPILSLGANLLQSFDIRQLASPLMKALASKHQISVTLACADGLNMVYLESCRSPSMISVGLNTGSRVPLLNTAIGRAYYVGMSELAQQTLKQTFMSQTSQQSHDILQTLTQAQTEFTQYGFVSSLGDFDPNIYALGVPVQSILPQQELLSLNVSCPNFQYTPEYMKEVIAPDLMVLAQQIALKQHV